MIVKLIAVSYLNTKPMLLGLQENFSPDELQIELDTPYNCGKKFLDGKFDVALVPSAFLQPPLPPFSKGASGISIFSDYCIGADGEVGSVFLFSDLPLKEIKNISLAKDSYTSNALVRILAKEFWKISPEFLNEEKKDSAKVMIGDKAMKEKNNFKYQYDLSLEWKKFAGLPFVFAVWVARKNVLSDEFIRRFNAAIEKGVKNISENISRWSREYNLPVNVVEKYFNGSLQFYFDEKKKGALKMFLERVRKL